MGFTKAFRQAIYDRDQRVCQLCGGATVPGTRHHRPDEISIDHKVPGAGDDPSNLQVAHRGCNSSKRHRADVPDFYRRVVTIGGVTRTLKEWAAVYHISPSLVRNRIDRGWEPLRALTTASRDRRRTQPGPSPFPHLDTARL